MEHTLNSAKPLRSVVSCPAKVLVGGGYLVLDPTYTGTVVATSSRFYAYFDPIISLHSQSNEPLDRVIEGHRRLLLVFRSPQFLKAEWSYLITWSNERGDHDWGITIEQRPDEDGITPKNVFLETVALQSIRLGFGLVGQSCMDNLLSTVDHSDVSLPVATIILLADNDFYSQPRDQSEPMPFNPLNVPISEVHKTGLGSSAAMVTSICGVMMLRLVPHLSDGQESGRISKNAMCLIHNLAQYVHSTAQGKIGSGFDISAAVWGTHIYRRFSEACLKFVPGTTDSQNPVAELRAIVDPKENPCWTDESTAPRVKPFTLPPLTTLILADVDAGSHTPSMVGKVLRWRKAKPIEANALWDEISSLNQRLGELCIGMNELFLQNPEHYNQAVLELTNEKNIEQTTDSCEQDGVKKLFSNLRTTMKETRKLMRKMGEASDVPIEPPSQTELLDECDKLSGVIGSGVPGAGGYDAIWVLVYSPTQKAGAGDLGTSNVVKLWDEWTKVSVRALSRDACVEGGQTDLPTGIRVENVEDVKGLSDVLNGTRRMSTRALAE